jgi:hypothetical protein
MTKYIELIAFFVCAGLLVGLISFAPIGPYFGKKWLLLLVAPVSVALIVCIVKTSLLRRLILDVAVFVVVGVGHYFHFLNTSKDAGYADILVIIYISWLATSVVMVMVHHWIANKIFGQSKTVGSVDWQDRL